MRKLLLIVDDWESLEWYENRLSDDFQVIGAPFGSEGLRLAKELQPDQIFIDLVFEDMSPIEAFKKLQSDLDTKKIPILMILESNIEHETQWPEGTCVLTRPFDFDKMVRLLKP